MQDAEDYLGNEGSEGLKRNAKVNQKESAFASVNAHRIGNLISSLKVNGIKIEEEEELNGGIATSFKSVFENPQVKRPDLEVDLFKDGDKAPRPDAFSLAFWNSWPIVEGRDGRYKDFRPISLMGSLYKLLAKIIANKLKRIVGKVVLEYQNAFVRSRQILDAVPIASEVIDSRKRSSSAGLVCNLDIKKAYDHVDWNFSYL
ncbi:hypothetical protein CK203_043169 [Vitis vinifera]|uniref:Reverse transcriptase domain-containing protein n=1 Tax=Vitis vinifera TaxID=29760 RepID=A0A438H3I1_VITVI|nr:hypothetical protein CK203_043169 [Vitis vinifera]